MVGCAAETNRAVLDMGEQGPSTPYIPTGTPTLA